MVGGEALVDLVPVSAEQMSTVDGQLAPLEPRLGGGPYNVALAASRLAAPTTFLSRISRDRFGDALLDRLHASGVHTSLVARGDEPTTLAVVALDEGGGARYTFYTEGTADRLVDDPGPLPEHVTALSVGTLGMVLEPGASAYETVLCRESGRGVLTMLDPNIRADLIADAEAYRARFRTWLPHVRILKVSVDDVAWLCRDADGLFSVESWLAAGVHAVVLTRGAEGISVFTGEGERARVAPAPAPARVVDTIGAGDTIQGALLAWLERHHVRDVAALDTADWRAALEFAAQAAAITVSRPGAEPPTAADLGR